MTITITPDAGEPTTLELDADTYRLIRRVLRGHDAYRVRTFGLALPALPGDAPERRRMRYGR